MNMNELPDDELDKLFRKSAEEFEPEFNPQAWVAMRKKLDEEDGKGGIAWWRAAILGLVLLGVGIGGYYLWPEKIDPNRGSTSSNNSTRTETKPSEQVSVRSKSEKTPLKSSQTEREVASAVKEEVQQDAQKKAILPRNAPLENLKVNGLPSTKTAIISPYKNNLVSSHPSRKRNTINTTKNKEITAAKRERKAFENQDITNSNSVKTASTAQTTSVELRTLTAEILPKEDSRLTLSNLDELSIHGWQLLKLPMPALLVDYQAPNPPVIPPKEEVAAVFQKGFSARIMAAPDLSFISTSQMMKNPTLALSIMLEYRFSRRLSVQAGVVRSVKLYAATGEQYQWPEAWNSQKVRPTEIGANCKVLDIPLNLRYDIVQRTKSRWFATSGMSSYVMLNEKYDYTYPPHTYGIKWKTWEGSTGNYWFGVMNLSLGFERQLGRHLSIQAEPYFKLPLAQVGMGKIKLNTSGVFISARYKLGRF